MAALSPVLNVAMVRNRYDSCVLAEFLNDSL